MPRNGTLSIRRRKKTVAETEQKCVCSDTIYGKKENEIIFIRITRSPLNSEPILIFQHRIFAKKQYLSMSYAKQINETHFNASPMEWSAMVLYHLIAVDFQLNR